MKQYCLAADVFEDLQARVNSSGAPVEVPMSFIETMTGRVARGQHFQVVGDTAVIPVVGLLEKAPSFMSFFFGGGTVFGDITAAIRDANALSHVKDIRLEIDSPGGMVEGLEAVADAVRDSGKSVIAHVTDKAASGAFWIASQASEIRVNNSVAQVGSIGAVVSMFVSDDRVTITSTKAPEKRPDPKTQEGRRVIQAGLDEIHDRFVAAVAAGRGVSVDFVNMNFGRGNMVSADAALAVGMIDGIGAREPVTPAAPVEQEEESEVMDIGTLKADHPAIYETIRAEGVSAGVAQERDRVTALVTMGEASGAMEKAITAIKAGDDLSSNQTLNAEFMAAGLNKARADDREEDNPEDIGAEGGDEGESGSNLPEVLDLAAYRESSNG